MYIYITYITRVYYTHHTYIPHTPLRYNIHTYHTGAIYNTHVYHTYMTNKTHRSDTHTKTLLSVRHSPAFFSSLSFLGQEGSVPWIPFPVTMCQSISLFLTPGAAEQHSQCSFCWSPGKRATGLNIQPTFHSTNPTALRVLCWPRGKGAVFSFHKGSLVVALLTAPQHSGV